MQKKAGRKRHSPNAIAKKLAIAERLRGEGRTQMEIAKALGVTVMTYSRWRKGQIVATPTKSLTRVLTNGSQANGGDDIHQLKAENRMLREIVLRMVLEREQSMSSGRGKAI